MYAPTLGLLLAGAGSALAALDVDFKSTASIKAAAKDVAFDVMSYYKGNRTGKILGLLGDKPPAGEYYWWNSALLWSTMIDYWRYTGDDTYNAVTVEGLTAQNGHMADRKGIPFLHFNWTVGTGNDDQGFWAMAGLQAAELGFSNPPAGQPSWLDLAKGVFEALAIRWGLDATVCSNGGLRWMIVPMDAGYNYKNTISNAVFANLGARLARYTGNTTYGEWADKSWTWLTEVGFIDADSSVFDGAHVEKNCSDLNPIQWTYTAGVLIETAAFMYNETSSKTWLNRLTALTNHTLSHFFPASILAERACELPNQASKCTGDMRFLKGILLRSLASAAPLAAPVREALDSAGVLKATAEAAVKTCEGGVRGRECSWEGEVGVQEEMNVLAAMMGVLAQGGEGKAVGKQGAAGSGGQSGTGSGSGNGDGSQGGSGEAGSGNEGAKSAGATVKAGMAMMFGGLVAALV
ncbi:glycosyl hydrolase family 76-domain-containing protein [Staphylotrichum tortipilum]|uniref:Mannan endo-1,6-alpha-mannosidase n=1 Tax=Staphylotrichum tortipilum TaxID=2831512 RepID=A0AAN6RQN5_9PEZI|nr:glycosyl hydrolase family 76-domain-containing protein [Staphylotrichum longicolle]